MAFSGASAGSVQLKVSGGNKVTIQLNPSIDIRAVKPLSKLFVSSMESRTPFIELNVVLNADQYILAR